MNAFSDEADALALELVEVSDQSPRVLAIAALLARLAARMRHGAEEPVAIPPGVAAVWAGGRWHERPRRGA